MYFVLTRGQFANTRVLHFPMCAYKLYFNYGWHHRQIHYEICRRLTTTGTGIFEFFQTSKNLQNEISFKIYYIYNKKKFERNCIIHFFIKKLNLINGVIDWEISVISEGLIFTCLDQELKIISFSYLSNF